MPTNVVPVQSPLYIGTTTHKLEVSGSDLVVTPGAGKLQVAAELDVTGLLTLTTDIRWSGDPDTTIGHPAGDQIQFTTGGSARLTVANTTTTLAGGQLVLPGGGAQATPTLFFGFQEGITSTALNTIDIVAASKSRLRVTPSQLFFTPDPVDGLDLFVVTQETANGSIFILRDNANGGNAPQGELILRAHGSTGSIRYSAEAHGADDSGTDPIARYDARLSTGAVATRPLMEWTNNGTRQFYLPVSGRLESAFSTAGGDPAKAFATKDYVDAQSGGSLTVQASDVTVSSNANTLDFDDTVFDLTESPAGEVNVTVPTATDSARGLMTSQDRIKLDSIDAGAMVNPDFQLNGTTVGSPPRTVNFTGDVGVTNTLDTIIVNIPGEVPATTSVNGLVRMSVAPASAPVPLVVGDNDPRMSPATDSQNGLFSMSDRLKLDSIDPGAKAYPIFGNGLTFDTVDETLRVSLTVKDGGTNVTTEAYVFDFVSAAFVVTESPAREINIDFNEAVLENGGAQEIDVGGLSGVLAQGQPVTVQEEGSNITGTPHTVLNFTGAGVTASNAGGGVATINVPGLTVQEGESTVGSGITTLDFASAPFTVTETPTGEINIGFDESAIENGGANEISVAGLSGQLADRQLFRVMEEGSTVGTVDTINFIGTGVTAALNGSRVDVTVTSAISGTVSTGQIPFGSGSNTLTSESALTYDTSTNTLSAENTNFNKQFRATLSGGPLAADEIPIILEPDIRGTEATKQVAMRFNVGITSGTGAGNLVGMEGGFGPGYTGTSGNFVINVINENESTGTELNLVGGGAQESDCAVGIHALAGGANGGTRVGIVGAAQGGDYNVGVLARSFPSGADAVSIGLLGFANSSGAGGVSVGGYFTRSTSGGANPVITESAALMCDNAATNDPIFTARDGGATVFQILNGGNVDFFNNQGVNFVFENSNVDPSSPVEGQVYWNPTNDELMVHDGTDFVAIGGGSAFDGDLAGDTLTDSVGTLNVLSGTGLHIVMRTPFASGNTHGQMQLFAPVSTTNTTVHDTGLSTHFGLFIVNMHDGTGRVGLFLVRGTGAPTLVSESPTNSFTVTKDTASRINVYYETASVKVQNNIGTGALAFSLYGSNNF